MSSPWMPFFIGDYLRDTRSLTLEEHGAYMLLIMEYWSNGGLPKNDEKIAQILGISRTKFKRISPNIKRFFSENWEHKRIDEELQKAKERSEKARNSINKRWSKGNTKEDTNVYSNEDTSVDTNVILPQPQPQLIDKSINRARTKVPSAASRFDEFYKAYPNKVRKPEAVKAYAKVADEHDDIMSGLARYIKNKPSTREWCNPATFLNQRRWEDEPAQQEMLQQFTSRQTVGAI
jgi:uncharacterized protein YdaU (DUF1376 family)